MLMMTFEKEKLPIPILEGHEDWINLYYLAWETAFKNIEYIDKPGWKTQLSCMPGVGITWLWDSCFMTFITNYSNGTLSAFHNLDNIYRFQRETDGYISMAYRASTDNDAYPGGRINPPIAAWAEWQHYVITGDVTRFSTVIKVLERFYNYIENTHRRSCGLYWFEDPCASGMDNSPRGGFDTIHYDGSNMCHIDLACQQALSAACISSIYSVLGNDEKVQFYKQECTRICELINQYHWSDKAGFYFDIFTGEYEIRERFINSKTAAAFWTLLCGCTDKQQSERMLEHLFNENEFYTKVPFCSLSKDDLNYDASGGYWLGGVWAPTNYVAIRGLTQNGYYSLAREATQKYLASMCSVANNPNYGGIWEAYCPEKELPSTTDVGELVRENFVGWSGLAPITLLIETIIGLSLNAPSNSITLQLSHEKHCGIRNLLFNGCLISVEYQWNQQGGKDFFAISVKTEQPFLLILKNRDSNEDIEISVPIGINTYQI